MYELKTVDQLWNFLAYVLGSAPDEFPVEDFLSAEEQMNLDKAFVQLHKGILIAYPENEFESLRKELSSILNECHEEYKFGDEIKAGHLLLKFQNRIFKT